MDFDDISSLENYIMPKLRDSLDDVMTNKIKEKARKIINDKWYGKYKPSMYDRMMLLTEQFEVKTIASGNEVISELFIKDVDHPYNETWLGDKIYSFEEIITSYMVRDHTYTNGKSRAGVDTMAETEEYAMTNAMRLLLNELKKYFTII